MTDQWAFTGFSTQVEVPCLSSQAWPEPWRKKKATRIAGHLLSKEAA